MDIQKAEEMYRIDPVFRALVDGAIGAMQKMDYTPGELRAAAMLAAIKFEQREGPLLNRPVFLDMAFNDELKSAYRAAIEDARKHGTGYIYVTASGSTLRLPPDQVITKYP